MPRNPLIQNRLRDLVGKVKVAIPLIPLSLYIQSPNDNVLMRYLCPGPGSIKNLRIVASGISSAVVVLSVSNREGKLEENIELSKGEAFDAGPFVVADRDLVTITLVPNNKDEVCKEAYVCALYEPEYMIASDVS